MKQYIAPLYEIKLPAPKESIVALESWHWEGDKVYRPRVKASLVAAKRSGIFVEMSCWDRKMASVYTERDDPVYEDSCLEFFIAAKPGDPRYINIEVNPNGVYLSQFGEARENRIFLKEITELAPRVHAISFLKPRWKVYIDLTLELLKALYGEDYDFYDGQVMRGNFYKCGDKTKIPHWGAWSPVTTTPPGFHNPACFGEIILTEVK